MTTTGGTTGVVQPLSPLTPVANLGNLYMQGMYLTYATTTTFTVSKGQCRDTANLTDILLGTSEYSYYNQSNEFVTPLPVAVTVNLAVSGAGGIDVGTVAASTLYNVYAIGDSKGFLNASVVLSTATDNLGTNTGGAQPTAVTLPTGPTLPSAIGSDGKVHQYDCFRYIGSISTNGSSQIRPFMQTGEYSSTLRTMWYDPGTGPSTKGVVIPSSGTGGSTSYVNVGVLTTLIPQSNVELILSVALTPNSANNVIYLAPATIDNGTTATVGSMAAMSAAATGSAQVGVVRVPVSLPNSTQRAALTIGNVVTALYATTSASDAVVFLLSGYVDVL